jgi:hypothetical protein
VTLCATLNQDPDWVALEFQVSPMILATCNLQKFEVHCETSLFRSPRRTHEIVAKDVVGTIMQARDRDSGQLMSDMQLAHETTAGVLKWTWYLLSTYPEVRHNSRLNSAGCQPSTPSCSIPSPTLVVPAR